MLRSIQNFKGLTLQSKDGPIGEVKEVLFDDEKWAVRYLVVKTGSWLLGRSVLISPISVEKILWNQKLVVVSLTRKQVEDSPDIDTDEPVSRQMEHTFHSYYRWPYYWTGAGIWGSGAYPGVTGGEPPVGLRWEEDTSWGGQQQESNTEIQGWGDIHLRSSHEVVGYRMEAPDGTFGHLENLIVEDQTWKIRYLVVDTKKFWHGKAVLLPPEWVESVSWIDRKFRLQVSERVIKQAPEYDSQIPIDREFEKRLYGYYGRSGYWELEKESVERQAG